MRPELYWIDGNWRGRLAISPRPRGGDWLPDEVQSWQQAGVQVVVSLLTRDEIAELELWDEEMLCQSHGMEFIPFPVADRGVPPSARDFSQLLRTLADRLAGGRTIVVHCRQGIGRAGLVAVGLLLALGIALDVATGIVQKIRACPIPETAEQRRWIEDFSRSHIGQAA